MYALYYCNIPKYISNRFEKCRACYEELSDIKNLISEKATISGKIGGTFRELQLAFATTID